MGGAILAGVAAFFAFKYLTGAKPDTKPPVSDTGNSAAVAPNQITDNMLKQPVEVAGASSRAPSGGSTGTTTAGSKTDTPSYPVRQTSTTILGYTYPVSSQQAGTGSGLDPNTTRDAIIQHHAGLYF